MERIPVNECVDRHVYELRSRNLRYGVFNAANKSFIGIRKKFDYIYLDVEYYPEDNARGTANPIKEIGIIPDDIDLVQGRSSGGFFHENEKLLAALQVFII